MGIHTLRPVSNTIQTTCGGILASFSVLWFSYVSATLLRQNTYLLVDPRGRFLYSRNTTFQSMEQEMMKRLRSCTNRLKPKKCTYLRGQKKSNSVHQVMPHHSYGSICSTK